MKMQINKEEMRREWVLEKWYQKTFYVVGLIMSVYMVIMFCIGFIEGFFGI